MKSFYTQCSHEIRNKNSLSDTDTVTCDCIETQSNSVFVPKVEPPKKENRIPGVLSKTTFSLRNSYHFCRSILLLLETINIRQNYSAEDWQDFFSFFFQKHILILVLILEMVNKCSGKNIALTINYSKIYLHSNIISN